MKESPESIGILVNAERARALSALTALLETLRRQLPYTKLMLSEEAVRLIPEQTGITAVANGLHELVRANDLIIALGGDGTMLSAARAILRQNPSARLLGVNLGKLGFIAENPPEEIEEIIRELALGELHEEPRLMLAAKVESEKNPLLGTIVRRDDVMRDRENKPSANAELLAFNEIVIDNFGSTRMLTFEVLVDGALLGVMRADGLLVATPTGSTGYAVSAGGPIVEPTSQVMLITPIAPHSLNIRPIIVPQHVEIVVRANSEETKQALIVADGQEEVVAETPALVRIVAAQQSLHLLRRKDHSYFELLRNKLFWSQDARNPRR
ncbi:MAG: NAD(+)/NADH kinase [Candidatus Kapaibacterium sp.]